MKPANGEQAPSHAAVGPRTAALGFTRADLDACRRKAERIERKRRRIAGQRESDRQWELKNRETDVLAGLRTLWRIAEPEDRPALERIAQRVRRGLL